MAITQSGAITTVINSTAGTTCAPAIPASMTTNHIMRLTVCVNGNKTGSISTPAGWTMIGTPAFQTSGVTVALYWRRWVSGDTAPSVTWTTSNKNVGCIVPWLGVDLTTPIDTTPPTWGVGTTASGISPTNTATTMGAVREHVCGRAGTGVSTPDWRMVEAVDITSSSTSPAALTCCYELGMASGALGTRTSTHTSAAWVAATVWLRPAVPETYGLLQSAFNGSGAVTSLTATFPNALTSGSLLTATVASWVLGGLTPVNDVDYTGAALNFTKHTNQLITTGGGADIAIWYYLNNTDTTAAVVTARRPASESIRFLIQEWKAATDIDVGGSSSGTGASVAATTSGATTSGQDILLLSGVTTSTGMTAFTYDTTTVPRHTTLSAADADLFCASEEVVGGTTHTVTHTQNPTTANYAHVLATFKTAAGGAPPPNKLALLGVG